MKRLLLLCSLVIMIFGCSDHPATKEEKFETFDYVAYHYSVDSLREPKVMVYVCDSGNIKTYRINDTKGSGDHLIMNIAGYKSDFQLESIMQMQISKDSVKMRIFAIKAPKDSLPKDWQLIDYCNSRLQPLGDKTSYIIRRTRKKSKGYSGSTVSEYGHFTKASVPAAQNYYKGGDCIKFTNMAILQYMDSDQHERSFKYTNTFYYARNIGCIYVELYDPKRKNHISKYKLENIISLKEFEKLQASHIVSK